MEQQFNTEILFKLKQRRRRKFWRRALSVMMCIVVFCTTYALILPAITQETETFCGIEAHTHTEDCFDKTLLCENHVHTDECVRQQEKLICTESTEPEHIHSEACEPETRTDLTCGMEETAGHSHSEACAPQTQRNLICAVAETAGHTHTEGCSEIQMLLACGQEESEGHSHDAQCFTSVLTCTLAEDENHTHGDGCYSDQLTCTVAESAGHSHSDSCYTAVTTNVCGMEEAAAHSHTDGCYTETITYGCGLEEIPAHSHSDGCYTTTTLYGCGLEEVPAHVHGEGCYEYTTEQICKLETDPEHVHTEDCYLQDPVCEKEEHEHGLVCYANPNADLETASDWEATLPDRLSGEYAQDVLAVARSQLGYFESVDNYIVSEDNALKGYTRYGAWYGIPYGDWCAMYVSFCLHYAGVEDVPLAAGCHTWIRYLTEENLYASATRYTPVPGDLIFFEWGNDDGGITDHVGLVTEVIPETDTSAAKVITIEGNSGNTVRYNTYNLTDPIIVGYGLLPEQRFYCGHAGHVHGNCGDCQMEEHIHTQQCEDPAMNAVVDENGTVTKNAVIFTDETYNQEADDTTVITLTGAIPENAVVKAYPVALEGNRVLCAYDIAIFLPDGTMFEPDPDQPITVAIQSAAIQEEDLEVYYHPDEGEPEYVDSTVTEEGISFDTNHFSTYAVYAADDPYDLSNYVQTVTVERKGQDEAKWQPVENGTVYVGDALRFDLTYLITEKVLDANNRVLTYNLPVSMSKADSGYVTTLNERNEEVIVGSYNVSEDGVITITFNEEYATKNGNGSEISGHIAFETTVDSLDLETDGSIDLPFRETIHLQVEGMESVTNDLQVTKQASNANVTGGTVDYTIVVTSEKGTGSSIILNDVLTNINVDGDITVKNENGRTIKDVTITETNNGFSMELPQLDAGGSYTITYSAKIPNAQNLNGTLDANNKVKVQSTDKNNGKLVDEDEVDTTFIRNMLDKTGKLDGNTITWTVVVNTSKIDIGGWELRDYLEDEYFTGSVTISPNPATGSGSTTVNLPYIFPEGSNQTYTVTYQTKLNADSIGTTNYTNTAVLIPDEGGHIEDGTDITTVDYNPLDKEAAGVVISGELANGDLVADFKWKVTIDAAESNIRAYPREIEGQTYNAWYYEDEVWDENRHWITGAQLKAMAADLAKNYSGSFQVIGYEWKRNSGKYNNPTPLEQLSDTQKYSQFHIIFFETLPKGSKIEFTYCTTIDVNDGSGSRSAQNMGRVNGTAEKLVSQTYRPVVTKRDKLGSGDTTEHMLGDLTHSGLSGVLGWNVTVRVPDAEFTKDLIIIEDIPDDTYLMDRSGGWNLSFSLDDFSNHNFEFESATKGTVSGTHAVSGVRYTVTAEYIDGAFVITVPAGLANDSVGKDIGIQVRLQIDEDFQWDDAYKTFENKVIVLSGGTELGKTSQSQIIHNPVLVKASGTVGNNTIPYILDINPESRNLLEHTDSMTLTDVLEYQDAETGVVNATLILSSVKVYKINPDGSQEDISEQCPFTVGESSENGTNRKKIVMTLPDDVHLQVQYSYRVTGTMNAETTFDNTATIEGLGQSIDDDKHDIEVSVEKSNAGATLVGVQIIKLDAEDSKVYLEGAKFGLEIWDGTKFTRVKLFTTNEDGIFATGELQTDTAYQLVEVESPHGYEIDPTPYQFYIVGTGESLSAPDDFKGKALMNGDSILRLNTKQAYKLPETGGTGTQLYTTAGLLLMLTSAAYLMYIRTKRRREDSYSS